MIGTVLSNTVWCHTEERTDLFSSASERELELIG